MSAPRPPLKTVLSRLLLGLGVFLVIASAWVASFFVLGALAAAALAPVFNILLLWAFRRRGIPLVGPLFFYDVVRLARRGRGTALRFAIGVALLVVLGIVYNHRFPE